MNDVTIALQQLADLTASVERAVSELKDAAGDYSDEAHHSKKNGERVTSFSGSPSHALADNLTLRLRAASQQIGGVAGELVRFVQ